MLAALRACASSSSPWPSALVYASATRASVPGPPRGSRGRDEVPGAREAARSAHRDPSGDRHAAHGRRRHRGRGSAGSLRSSTRSSQPSLRQDWIVAMSVHRRSRSPPWVDPRGHGGRALRLARGGARPRRVAVARCVRGLPRGARWVPQGDARSGPPGSRRARRFSSSTTASFERRSPSRCEQEGRHALLARAAPRSGGSRARVVPVHRRRAARSSRRIAADRERGMKVALVGGSGLGASRRSDGCSLAFIYPPRGASRSTARTCGASTSKRFAGAWASSSRRAVPACAARPSERTHRARRRRGLARPRHGRSEAGGDPRGHPEDGDGLRRRWSPEGGGTTSPEGKGSGS